MEEEALRAESRVPSHLDERHEQRVVLVYTLAVGLKTKLTPNLLLTVQKIFLI